MSRNRASAKIAVDPVVAAPVVPKAGLTYNDQALVDVLMGQRNNALNQCAEYAAVVATQHVQIEALKAEIAALKKAVEAKK